MSKIIEDYLKYLADDTFEFDSDEEDEGVMRLKPKHKKPGLKPGNLRVGAAQGRRVVFSSGRSK